MKKLINAPEDVLRDALEGTAAFDPNAIHRGGTP